MTRRQKSLSSWVELLKRAEKDEGVRTLKFAFFLRVVEPFSRTGQAPHGVHLDSGTQGRVFGAFGTWKVAACSVLAILGRLWEALLCWNIASTQFIFSSVSVTMYHVVLSLTSPK